MANVRLKVNVVDSGRFYERDSVISDSILPDHLKTEAYVAYDLTDGAGLVLLLRDLNFSSVAKPGSDGVPVSYPIRAAAGDTFDLTKLPESTRKSLKEGEDFKTKWSNEDRRELQARLHADYVRQFETEPVPTYRSR
jgi:hypothetical protein